MFSCGLFYFLHSHKMLDIYAINFLLFSDKLVLFLGFQESGTLIRCSSMRKLMLLHDGESGCVCCLLFTNLEDGPCSILWFPVSYRSSVDEKHIWG